MIKETKDWKALEKAMLPYKEKTLGFEAKDWLSDGRNTALTDGHGSFALLQWDAPGVYYVHTFYTLTGKNALRMHKDCLKYIFENLTVEVLKGLTPVELVGAKAFARRAGFKAYGEVDTASGKCELFIITRKEYEG